MYMCFTPAMLKWVRNLTNIYSIAMLKVKCAKNTTWYNGNGNGFL